MQSTIAEPVARNLMASSSAPRKVRNKPALPPSLAYEVANLFFLV